ncbi:kinesin-like protein kif14, partial [Plakobranchus ocellatus]
MAANGSPRKVVKAKRVLPSVPPESPRLKSVHFNSETIETSIGGTQRVGRIKQDVLLHFDTPAPALSKAGSRKTSGQTTPRTTARLCATSRHHGKENIKVNGAVDSVTTNVNSVLSSESASEESSSDCVDVQVIN